MLPKKRFEVLIAIRCSVESVSLAIAAHLLFNAKSQWLTELPGVDVVSFFSRSGLRRGRRFQGAHYPAARIDGIDSIINFQM